MQDSIRWEGAPESVYSDDEPALSSKYDKQYFKEQNINHIITRSHDAMAERQIRTSTDMLYKRLGHSEDTDWTDQLGYVLLACNHKLVHSTAGFAPHDAKKYRIHLQVKINLELHGKHKRLSLIHISEPTRPY